MVAEQAALEERIRLEIVAQHSCSAAEVAVAGMGSGGLPAVEGAVRAVVASYLEPRLGGASAIIAIVGTKQVVVQDVAFAFRLNLPTECSCSSCGKDFAGPAVGSLGLWRSSSTLSRPKASSPAGPDQWYLGLPRLFTSGLLELLGLMHTHAATTTFAAAAIFQEMQSPLQGVKEYVTVPIRPETLDAAFRSWAAARELARDPANLGINFVKGTCGSCAACACIQPTGSPAPEVHLGQGFITDATVAKTFGKTAGAARVAESWLDNFETDIFNGKTLNELLHERGGL